MSSEYCVLHNRVSARRVCTWRSAKGFDVVHGAQSSRHVVRGVGSLPQAAWQAISCSDHHDLSAGAVPLTLPHERKRAVDPRVLRFSSGARSGCADVVDRHQRELSRHRHSRATGSPAEKVFIVRNGPDLTRVRLVEPDSRLRASGQVHLRDTSAR